MAHELMGDAGDTERYFDLAHDAFMEGLWAQWVQENDHRREIEGIPQIDYTHVLAIYHFCKWLEARFAVEQAEDWIHRWLDNTDSEDLDE